MDIRISLCIIISTLGFICGQDNAQTRIPETLIECYQNPVLMEKDNRLPMSINMLIDLIRKVEDSPNGSNMDIRTIAISLIHKFKLDGIIRSSTVSPSSHALPYSPHGFQFTKHKLLLSRLLPGNALLFPNSSITAVEKCSLHHMLSSSVAVEVRGDEGLVCNRLAQYRTQRIPRSVNVHGRTVSDDVEVLDQSRLREENFRGKLQNYLPPTGTDVGVEIIPTVYEERNSVAISQCPVEDGAIYTQWGAVAGGTLLAGIAAGLEPQSVPLNSLLQTNQTLRIDNRFAATLAGDLAELALLQGPQGPSNTLSIGAAGGWNNTQAPRWYFLSQSTNYQFTDAEIRGGLDGLILGLNIPTFRQKANTLKLSQLLDMYYSQRGVFTEQFRACNRKMLLTDVAATNILLDQAVAFTNYLDVELQHEATISEDGLREYATAAVTSFNSYVPNNLNDLSCTTTANTPSASSMRAASDLIIVLDSSWNYHEIASTISYLIDNLDVSKYGSNVTLLNAKDGSIIINSTQYLSHFHENFNILSLQSEPSGFDLPQVLASLRNISNQRQEHYRATSWSGGRSSVVLFILNSATVNAADLSYSVGQLRIFYDIFPDLYFLYAAAGSRERFNSLVRDSTDDIFTITPSTTNENVGLEISPIVSRIKRIPLRIINPWCGADWNPSGSGTRQLDGYVEPEQTVYYRLLPNYFYASSGSRVIRIQGAGYGTLNVCHSRTPLFTRLNDTQGETPCADVVMNNIEIPLENFCEGHDYIHQCPPLYISVRAVPVAEGTQQYRCTENACRFTDSLRFTITTVDLGCFSGSANLVASLAFVLISLIMNIRQYI